MFRACLLTQPKNSELIPQVTKEKYLNDPQDT